MSLFDDANQAVNQAENSLIPDGAKNALGLSAKSASDAGSAPWIESAQSASPANAASAFYQPIDIDGSRWDKLFPYRFIVIDTKKGNSVAGTTGAPADVTVYDGTAGEVVAFEKVDKWVFTLPISPESLSISDTFAINTSATLKGVVEEHNALPFKTINASGTFGVWADRTSVTKPPSTPGPLQSIFGGTIAGFSNLISQAQSVVNVARTGHKTGQPVSTTPDQTAQGFDATGYFQALTLQQFLEQYAIAKLEPKNASWRLVFDIPKQNQSFIVTPMQFNWRQDKQRPMEVQFNLQLKAWRRVDLGIQAIPNLDGPSSVNAGLLQRVLNTISQARSTAASAIALIGAVRSDVANVFNVLKQTSLLVKDLAGVVVTAADLPNQIISDAKSTIAESLANIAQAGAKANLSTTVNALTGLSLLSAKNEGLSQSAVASGQLGPAAAAQLSIDPANNVFSSPDANFDLFDMVPVYSLSLTTAQQNKVDQAIESARNLTVADIKSFRATIQELTLQLSNSFGAGDAYYNEVYGRPAPSTSYQAISLDQFDILNDFYETLTAFDELTATTYLDDINRSSNMEYVAGLAEQSGIAFSIPTSKVLAPVPFGLSIEAIAQRYLGDPQRWLEIVTLNNLRDPYIDENGFVLSLLSNASGRQVTIPSSDDLYVGQRIVLKSASQSSTARVILDIDRLSDTSSLLTLDGDADLDIYLLQDQAYVQAYLPGTVNSQQKIFIPSDLPADQGASVIAPASTLSDPLTGMSRVDILLDDSGDVAVNNYGDFRLASGVTNLIQALKIKFGNVRNGWLLHPEFGIGIRPGTINSQIDVQNLYKEISAFVTQDPRFSILKKLQIELNGPVLNISMAVQVAGVRGVFPVSFTLTAS